jgi:hypothetical protein
MSKFEEEIIGERVRITTRQEFIKKAKEACEFGVSEMDALTILADDAYAAGMTCDQFAEILIEGGYAPWVASDRAKSDWEDFAHLKKPAD